MLRHQYLFGGILSILITGTALPITASAADTPSQSATTTTRPSIEQLQTAINNLESTGSYRAYFIDQSTPLTTETPHYKEYRYLNKLVNDIKTFIVAYDELPDELLRDAILASNDAVRSCNILFNADAKLAAIKESAVATNATQSAATPTTNTGKAVVASNQTTQTNIQKSTVTPATTEPVTNATETKTIEADVAATPAEETSSATTIDVPATGTINEDAETKSPLPLFAALIAGAAAVSIIIAAILHRQPKSHF